MACHSLASTDRLQTGLQKSRHEQVKDKKPAQKHMRRHSGTTATEGFLFDLLIDMSRLGLQCLLACHNHDVVHRMIDQTSLQLAVPAVHGKPWKLQREVLYRLL